MTEPWVRKTITTSDANDYWFNVRSGECQGMVYLDYEETGVDGKKKTVTISFDIKFADKICEAIKDIAEHEWEQLQD